MAASRRAFQTTAMMGFAILALLLAFGMAFSIHGFATEANTQLAYIRLVEDEITMVERLRWSASLIVSNGRGYLLTGDPAFIEQVQQSRRQFNQTLGTLRAQTLVLTRTVSDGVSCRLRDGHRRSASRTRRGAMAIAA